MIMTKKVNIGGEFAKVGEDLVNGTVITILNAGVESEGKFGPRIYFKVKTKNGDKVMSFNQTSINNLVDAFGADTEGWVNKMVKVYVVKAMVSGKMHNVVYVCSVDWDMLDDGSFSKKKGEPIQSSHSDDDDFNVNDINF